MVNGLIQQLSNKFSGKKVLVVGLGLQGGGVGIARFFNKLGSIVKVTDLKTKEELLQSIKLLGDINITYTLGKHDVNDFLTTDFIFKGPSMPWDHEFLIQAENKKIPIDMEVAFTLEHLKCKTIGITGTRGKTTTTEMVFKLLQKTGKKIYKAGNLTGQSTIELLNKISDNDIVILELSSWSLSGFHRKKMSPHIAVFTNFYPDHLNYYKNMDDYFFDKKAIFMYQKENDICFINEQLKNKISENEYVSNIKFFSAKDYKGKLNHLKGAHNRENAVAAYYIGKLFNLSDQEIYDELKNFKSVKYRQEIVKIIDGVTVINDSTSTTPTSTIKAIETFSDKPTVLVLGGHSKNLPVNRLIEKLADVDKIVLIRGTFTDEILNILKNQFPKKLSPVFDRLDEAVKYAFEESKKINTDCYLLFSPGATSFAMFKNEFNRGDKFNEYVKAY